MERQDETESLVCQAQAGDRQAFDSLVERYREEVGAVIRSRLAEHLRQAVEVEELVQETMVRGFKSLKRFRWRGEGSFNAWLCAVAKHVVLKAVEQRRQYQSLEITDSVPAAGASPSRAMRRDERFDRLQAAIHDLSADHREVIWLARIDKLPFKAIAVRMNRSPGAVKLLLLRALRELKQRFGDTRSLHLPDRRLECEGGADVE